MEWRRICSSSELQLLPTLGGGQCFRWKTLDKDTWSGVFAKQVWFVKQEGDSVLYKTCLVQNERSVSGCDLILKKYLRLDTNLSLLYQSWSESDSKFKTCSSTFYGIRILNQDPVENIFSFICSSNNNIKRISSMVEKLCTMYGDKLGEINGEVYHDFPAISKLTNSNVEDDLRKAGFGYRAKYIYLSAKKIIEMGGDSWLDNLKTLPYLEAKAELMKLTGIGAKVADCICLMSLGHLQAIPVDTHIFQIASQYYLPHLRLCKSVTDKVYNEIGDYFRNLYGDKAGWAHTILFCADLKMFEDGCVTQGKKKKMKKVDKVQRKKLKQN